MEKNRCEICGARTNLVVHHKIPRSKGGSDDKENLQVLCRNCHLHVHNPFMDLRVLRKLLKEGERVDTGLKAINKLNGIDNTSIFFCNKQEKAFGDDGDCPRLITEFVSVKGRRYLLCAGEEACNWEER